MAQDRARMNLKHDISFSHVEYERERMTEGRKTELQIHLTRDGKF